MGSVIPTEETLRNSEGRNARYAANKKRGETDVGALVGSYCNEFLNPQTFGLSDKGG